MKKIIVCSDGSAYSDVGLRYAVWLSGLTESRLEFMYVSNIWEYEMPFLADLGGSVGASPYQGMVQHLQDMEEKKAEWIRERIESQLSDYGYSGGCVFFHETGSIVDSLKDYEAREGDLNLVVLGKRGESFNQASEHLGAMMERMVRASRHPCFVANREYRPIRKIVFAYDGGESCRRGLEWLCKNKLEADELHLISVGDAHGKGIAAEHLARAEECLRESGLDPHCQVLAGDVEDQIADYVLQKKADLLTMGAYGHNRIRHLLIGSTTTDLLRRCKMPMLLFR